MSTEVPLKKNGRLLIVSNRLPIVTSEEEGKMVFKSGSGGLVTALAPILKNRGGIWVGWPGHVKTDPSEVAQAISSESHHIGYTLYPVFLNEEEVKGYYNGFSNQIIWPLFHDLQSECRFKPEYWNEALRVSQKFAQVIERNSHPDDFIWVHDYHLMLVGQVLRKLKIGSQIAFFLHTPFPPLDIFLKLPWRFQILHALLEFDLIGFQTIRDQRNFTQCLRRLIPDLHMSSKGHMNLCKMENREVRIGSFPISIDFNEFAKIAEKKEVLNQAWVNLKQIVDQKIVFSLDRLDFTKGIPYRLEAIRHLLKNHPELHQKVTFIQIVIPSRLEILEYQNLKNEIDRLVSEINSEFTKSSWVPIQYLFRSVSRQELLAYYRTSEVVLVTPIKDGMNLVAKEFVASNTDENGVLILSEFAGAASQFQHEAFLINPYDIEGVSEAIFKALDLSKEERRKRMRKLRRNVRKNDVYRWLRSFLNAAISKELHDFPILEEYIPKPT